MPVEVKCQWCGVSFPSAIRKGVTAKYCSKVCYTALRRAEGDEKAEKEWGISRYSDCRRCGGRFRMLYRGQQYCDGMCSRRRLKYDLPPDDEIVALMVKHRNTRAAEKALGLPREILRRYIANNPELRERVEGLSDFRATATRYEYPSDDVLVEMMADAKTYIGVARMLGISRQAFYEYIRGREQLKARLESLNLVNRSEEEKRARVRQKRREWRKANPASKRWSSHHYGVNGKPHANDLEYMEMLLCDPCSYCGREADTIDHIEPVLSGGSSTWNNLTAACRQCNSRKSTRGLLAFLLASL